VLWAAVKLPARRFGFSVLQEDVGAPVRRNAIAPTEIRLTSIATSLVFSFDPLLARELRIQLSCNRTLLPGQSSLSKSPNKENSTLVALTLLPRAPVCNGFLICSPQQSQTRIFPMNSSSERYLI